jgi:hypothetical protein
MPLVVENLNPLKRHEVHVLSFVVLLSQFYAVLQRPFHDPYGFLCPQFRVFDINLVKICVA